MDAPEPVRTACYCPGTPHEEDIFELVAPDHLPMEAGVAAHMALTIDNDQDRVAGMVGALLRNGAITSWNLVDDDGDPVPVNRTTIGERLTWLKGGVALAGAALERYAKLVAPFGSATSAKKTRKSSRRGPTARSISAKTRSSSEPIELSA